VAAAIAAVVLVGALGLLARPRDASAAGFFQAVRATWIEVPACHRVIVQKWPQRNVSVETWYVRGKGGRQETRSADGAIGVVVNNGRWEFRWDVPERIVAAWSVPLIGKQSALDRAGLIENGDALLRWAETHRADIRVEPDNLGDRPVRKVTLRWPGPGGAGAPPQLDTIWFDPESLRPVRHRSEWWAGGLTDATFDYPAPENVPADLLAFQPPKDVTLEINDPDLGRQVYADPLNSQSDPYNPRGADR
jgi:hypothetical protein